MARPFLREAHHSSPLERGPAIQQRTIGVLSPLFGGFFFGGLLKGSHEEALQAGARVIAVQTLGEDFGLPQQLFSISLAEAYVDGWIAILDSVDHDHLRAIQAAGKPVVALSGVIPEVACAAVRPDNIGGMTQVIDHMIEHGHTRIAFIGSLHQADIQQRYEGYQRALRQHGIAPNHHMIFETFRQVQSDMAREYQGTGLGLPISKKLVAMHGGTMWLESMEGQGATFFFTLPVVPAQQAAGDSTHAVV